MLHRFGHAIVIGVIMITDNNDYCLRWCNAEHQEEFAWVLWGPRFHQKSFAEEVGRTLKAQNLETRLFFFDAAVVISWSVASGRYINDISARFRNPISAQLRFIFRIPLTSGGCREDALVRPGSELYISDDLKHPNLGLHSTSPTHCTDNSWRDAFFGKHEHGALWLLICGAIKKHLLTDLHSA